jgi:signal transduction histidine kinase
MPEKCDTVIMPMGYLGGRMGLTDQHDLDASGRFGTLSFLCGLSVLAISCVVLSGWVLDIYVLKSLGLDMVSMKVNTAAAFALAALTLCLLHPWPARRLVFRWAGRIFALLVAVLGFLTLFEYLSGLDLGIDQAIFREPSGEAMTVIPGRMAPNTAFIFLLLGLSLLLLDRHARRGARPAGFMIGLGSIIALAGLAGYGMGVSGLYAVIRDANPMSLPAALAAVISFVGLWLARPMEGFLGLLRGPLAGSVMARRLLLPLLLIPFLLEAAQLTGQRMGIFAASLGLGFTVVIQGVIFACLLWIAAASLNRADSRRHAAEEAEKSLASFPRLNPNPVIEADIDGRICYANPAATVLLRDQRQLEGGWLSGWESAIAELRRGRGLVREVGVGARWYQQSMSLVEETQRVRIYVVDVTERRQAEEEIRRANDELEAKVRERTGELVAEAAERKKAAEQVKAERQRLYAVMETLPIYVILLTEDYRVPYANRFFRERFGDSGGRRCYEYLFNRTEPCEVCETYKVFKTNAPCEWDWTGPDGHSYAIHDFPFSDTDGTRLIMEVGIDVTAEKQLREGLVKQAAQLRTLASELILAEQRERRRLAVILHDHLQQLLVGAKLRVAMLRRDADPADASSEGAGQARLAREIEDLLTQSIDASRTLTAELSPPILRDGGLLPALKWLARWMEETHGVTVTLAVDETIPAAGPDVATLLFQSVKELLFNAAKHAKVRHARVSASTVGGQMRIVVADEGAGFDQAILTLEGAKVGFGLFGIRERLDMLGGSMTIDTAPGKGTVVTLVMPLPASVSPAAVPRDLPMPGPAPEASDPAGQSSRRPGARIRLLLVDDHVILRQGLRNLLMGEGDLDIIGEAPDGETAIGMVRELHPDVVLMDVNMPGMGGIEATRAIRSASPRTAVIGLSMFDDQERAAEMLQAGAVEYHAKSGKVEALLAAVRRHACP